MTDDREQKRVGASRPIDGRKLFSLAFHAGLVCTNNNLTKTGGQNMGSKLIKNLNPGTQNQ